MKKERKKAVYIVCIILAVLIVFMVLIGFSDLGKNFTGKITGFASKSVVLNISVGAPQIVKVLNSSTSLNTISANGPNEAPNSTSILINFTAYSASGSGNLNDSTAMANVTYAGGNLRQNTTCKEDEASGNYANYSCNVTMWSWDPSGTWNISVQIYDNQSNSATNSSAYFYVGERTAFVMSPSTLTWASIAPGAENQTSNNDPLLLNNTGNDPIAAGSISINASNLRGETAPTDALWARNFSVSWQTGGSCSGDACTECGGTAMNRSHYEALAGANLSRGNYTINDGFTGQEKLYFCLRIAGTGLSTQAYSTANETEWDWSVQIA